MKAKQRLFGFVVLFGAAMFSLIGCETGLNGTPRLPDRVQITGIPKVGERLTVDFTGSDGFALHMEAGDRAERGV